uniref:hypothetical protein n=1 Tax=Prevotella sp. TaxID=59823 RepID=UPI00402840EC
KGNKHNDLKKGCIADTLTGILSWYDCHISTPYLIVAHKRSNIYVDLATKILRKTAIIQKKTVTLSSVVTL